MRKQTRHKSNNRSTLMKTQVGMIEKAANFIAGTNLGNRMGEDPNWMSPDLWRFDDLSKTHLTINVYCF